MSRLGVFKQSLRLFAVQSISETTKKAKKRQKCKKNSPDREIESSWIIKPWNMNGTDLEIFMY